MRGKKGEEKESFSEKRSDFSLLREKRKGTKKGGSYEKGGEKKKRI